MQVKLLQDIGQDKKGHIVTVSDKHGALLIKLKQAEEVTEPKPKKEDGK